MTRIPVRDGRCVHFDITYTYTPAGFAGVLRIEGKMLPPTRMYIDPLGIKIDARLCASGARAGSRESAGAARRIFSA